MKIHRKCLLTEAFRSIIPVSKLLDQDLRNPLRGVLQLGKEKVQICNFLKSKKFGKKKNSINIKLTTSVGDITYVDYYNLFLSIFVTYLYIFYFCCCCCEKKEEKLWRMESEKEIILENQCIIRIWFSRFRTNKKNWNEEFFQFWHLAGL